MITLQNIIKKKKIKQIVWNYATPTKNVSKKMANGMLMLVDAGIEMMMDWTDYKWKYKKNDFYYFQMSYVMMRDVYMVKVLYVRISYNL